MKKYRVQLMKDFTYEVIEKTEYYDYFGDSDETNSIEESVFQGNLSDCESYIRLAEKGQI